MVIEDDPTIQDVLKILFQMESIDAYWASCGAEALSMLEHIPVPKFVLLDGRLPDIHGLELASKIHERTDESATIYLCSADSECEEMIVGTKIRGFIPKPFDADRVVAIIKDRLAS